MTESDIHRLLEELASSAADLKKEADSLEEVIEGVEKRLAEMNLGMEVWEEDHPLQTRDLSVSASNVAPRVAVQLGFAPFQRSGQIQWHLQIREAEYTPQPQRSDGDALVLARVLRVRKLADCPREERLAALNVLPALLQRMTTATRERTQTIRDTRNLL